MADSYTINKSLIKPAYNSYIDDWDTPVNLDWDYIDAAFGSTTSLNVTGQSGTIVLTETQYRSAFISITGTLTANVDYQIPTNVGGSWIVNRNTSGAFTVQISSGGGGTSATIYAGDNIIYANGTDVRSASSSSGSTLINSHIFVGNSSNVAADVAMSGDTSITNAGVVTVGSIGGKAIVLANSFGTAGNFPLTLTQTGLTNVTLPTTGTLATLAGLETLTNKTINGSNNTLSNIALNSLASQSANTFLANATSGSASPTAIALAVSQLVGRGATGDISPISLGSGLSMVGTTLVPSALLPTGYIYGLQISNSVSDATNDIVIAAGKARSSDDTEDMVLASSLTKQLDALWAVGTNQGGRDTGSIADGLWAVWLIERTDTGVVDALFSTSFSSPTMPTNYNKKRLIGAIRRASSTIIPFSQSGDQFFYSPASAFYDLNNTSSSVNWTSVTTSVPPYCVGRFGFEASSSTNCGPSYYGGQVRMTGFTVASGWPFEINISANGTATFELKVNGSRQIDVQGNLSGSNYWGTQLRTISFTMYTRSDPSFT